MEPRDEERIFGLAYRREAEVAVLNGFSAHADQAGLLWCRGLDAQPSGAPVLWGRRTAGGA
ncbi:MAG: hypothetical protein EPO40_03635 [Myxococcaceae bacterium]|nr:MAG: hypothetical protein EPO40_03635 [Myxococcaceae bacterium]